MAVKKKYWFLILILFIPMFADETSVQAIKEAKVAAKNLGKAELVKCKTLTETDRQLRAANYTGRAEELAGLTKIFEEDLNVAIEEKNELAATLSQKNLTKLIKRVTVYLYFSGLYRDNCRVDIVEKAMEF